jgi:6-phosphogluconolactonase (cycloisomerase 2 family)
VFFVADLGLDQLFSYSFNPLLQTLSNLTVPAATSPGAGPRHTVVTSLAAAAHSPDAFVAHVLCEMGSTIETFAMDPSTGALQGLVSQVSTLPQDTVGFSKAAEIVALRDDVIYVSNRGNATGSNSIVVFSADHTTGALSEVQRVDSGGLFPRGIILSPNNDFLIVGGQDSRNVATFAVDATDGTLTQVTDFEDIVTPVTFAWL